MQRTPSVDGEGIGNVARGKWIIRVPDVALLVLSAARTARSSA